MQYDQQWNTARKISFRFVFILLLLYIIVFNNGAYSFIYGLLRYLYQPLHSLIPWFAKNILNLSYPITVFTNGSGDTTYDYVCLLFICSLAVFGCLLWTIIDRKSTNYNRLYYWITVGVRYYVGFMLINYGFSKVFKSQFASPGFYRLNQTFGDSSPMGLAWIFLGFSKGYNYFMGFAELLGVLLIFRRTVTIGAFLALMTCANIMAVNYFYDVPVKILSTALVLMCLFLLTPNIKPLWQLFFKAKTVHLNTLWVPAIRKKWLFLTMRTVKFLMLFLVIASSANSAWFVMKNYGEGAKKPAFYGSYDVELISAPKINMPDSVVWEKLMVEYGDYVSIRFRNDSLKYYPMKYNKKQQSVLISKRDSTIVFSGKILKIKDKEIRLAGIMNADSVSLLLKRKDKSDFRLTGRDFHWISEYPYNR